MQKYYAVKNGRNVGIFTDWTSCEQQVKGFRNCQFKSFKTLRDAERWLNDTNEPLPPLQGNNKKETLYIYTDGSYINKQCGYGVAIIRPESIVRLYGPCENFLDSRNVAGECTAAIKALEWAMLNGYSDLKIYHDFNGIGEWISDSCQSNKPLQKWYKESIQKFLDNMKVEFIHVKAHNGDQWNNYVDKLAKMGAQSMVCKQDIKIRQTEV